MATIKATGLYFGSRFSVEAFKEDGSIVLMVDGEENEQFQNAFDDLLKRAPPLGGTYFPPPDSMLAALTVLEQSFFEKCETLEVIGELEEIPYEDGKVY